MKLTLLGTGVPRPDLRRRGPSQVVEAGGGLILIDCGSGALYRLIEAGYERPAIRCIVLTHLHSDHTTGLPDLLWAGWIWRWWDEPPPLIGPPGTAAMLHHLIQAFSYDISVRERVERLRGERLQLPVVEVEDGRQEEGNGWRLTAFRVDHGPVDQAFGFRVDADDASVVVSGDTVPCENLIRQAQGADLLVHEVYWRRGFEESLRRIARPEARASQELIASYHTSSEEVGQVAERAGVKHLVLSHLILRGGSPDDLRADVARQYHGMVTVGEDLQTFALGRS